MKNNLNKCVCYKYLEHCNFFFTFNKSSEKVINKLKSLHNFNKINFMYTLYFQFYKISISNIKLYHSPLSQLFYLLLM